MRWGETGALIDGRCAVQPIRYFEDARERRRWDKRTGNIEGKFHFTEELGFEEQKDVFSSGSYVVCTMRSTYCEVLW